MVTLLKGRNVRPTMATILLNGIPGTKSGIVESVQASAGSDHGLLPVKQVSIGALLAERGKELFGTDPSLVANMDYSYRQMLRQLAHSDAKALLADASDDSHIVIDTPLTLYAQGGDIPEVIFPQPKIQALHSIRPLDHIVSLMDSPEHVAERLGGQPYPHNPDDSHDTNIILDWMIYEGMQGEANAPYDPSTFKPVVPHIVIPRQNADVTLVKMLYHYQTREGLPKVAYLAGPITHLKDKEGDAESILAKKAEDRERMHRFSQAVQEYIITVVPMTIADGRASERKQVINTVFRDKHWFVQKSNVVVAFFPGDYESQGTVEEMRHAARIGKPVILIHPRLPDNEVFGFRPTLGYKDEEQFFRALESYDPENMELRALSPLFYQGVASYKGLPFIRDASAPGRLS